jgi:hypothetical protein
MLRELLPDATLIGIDEQTGAIGDHGVWTVSGRGTVTLYRSHATEVYRTGQQFALTF